MDYILYFLFESYAMMMYFAMISIIVKRVKWFTISNAIIAMGFGSLGVILFMVLELEGSIVALAGNILILVTVANAAREKISNAITLYSIIFLTAMICVLVFNPLLNMLNLPDVQHKFVLSTTAHTTAVYLCYKLQIGKAFDFLRNRSKLTTAFATLVMIVIIFSLYEALWNDNIAVALTLAIMTFALLYAVIKLVDKLPLFRKWQESSETQKEIVEVVLDEKREKKINRLKSFFGLD